jgi:hypothetical protein
MTMMSRIPPSDRLRGNPPGKPALGGLPPLEVGGKPPPSPALLRLGASARPVGFDSPLGLRRPASIVGFLSGMVSSF